MLVDEAQAAAWLAFGRADHDSTLGRWTHTFAVPLGPLAEWFELFWFVDSEESYAREKILPRSSTEVLFNLGPGHLLRDPTDPRRDRRFDRAWISGLQQAPLYIESPRSVRLTGIRLRPAGALQFLGASPQEIALQVVDLEQVFGAWSERLRGQLADAPTPEKLLTVLASAAVRRCAAVPAVRPEVRAALAALEGHGGDARIRDLARACGWSERHFVHTFRREVGLAPKAFSRVLRFQRALTMLQVRPAIGLAIVAAECGYFDQAHMARDFTAFADAPPAEARSRQSPDTLSLIED